jgi:RND family efflux transporter MFP subunit
MNRLQPMPRPGALNISIKSSLNCNVASIMKNFLVPCLLPVVAATALTSCSRTPAPAPPSLKVTVSQPQAATVANWDEYPGHVEAVETVEIRPRVSGYIDSIHFQDGADVKAGDLLFVIDPRPYQAELERVQAESRRAETRLELVQNDFKRAEGLRGTRAISEEEYDNRSKAVRAAEADLAAARAGEAVARINLDYTQIKAPITGKIGRRLITAGNFVQLQGNGGAATVLATIVSLDPIYCYFDADEQAYPQYRRNGSAGQAESATDNSIPCELALVNEEGYPHKGRVDFFDNEVNPTTGTIRMRAVFANENRALIPGLFAKVRLTAGPPQQTLLIPDVAVGSDQGYKFVFVVNKDNVIEVRSIETGRAHGPLRSVLKGLTVQDRVVVNGLMMLRPGVKVEITDGASGAMAPKAQAGQ